jgi:hypothetical protein
MAWLEFLVIGLKLRISYDRIKWRFLMTELKLRIPDDKIKYGITDDRYKLDFLITG